MFELAKKDFLKKNVSLIAIPVLGIASILYLYYVFTSVTSEQDALLSTYEQNEVKKIKYLDSLYSKLATNHALVSGLLANTAMGLDEGQLYDLSIDIIDRMQKNIDDFAAARQRFIFNVEESKTYDDLLIILKRYHAAVRSSVEMTTVAEEVITDENLKPIFENIIYANDDFILADKQFRKLSSLVHNSSSISFSILKENTDKNVNVFFVAVFFAIAVLIISAVLTLRTVTNKAKALTQKSNELISSNAVIKQQRNKVVSLLNNMKDGYILMNDAWSIIEINERARALLSESSVYPYGKIVWDIFPETIGGFYKKLKYSVQHKERLTFEAYYPPSDCWLSVDTYPDGSELAIFFQDITDRVHYIKTLEKSEKRIRSIVDNAMDGIVTFNRDGKVGSFNHAAEEMFGYAANEVIDKDMKSLIMFNDQKKNDENYGQFFAANGIQNKGSISLLRARHKDGHTFPIEMSVGEVQLNDSSLFTGIIRDVTQRLESEEKARRALIAQHDAESANNAKSMFLASMSHELRTPLNAILGFGQLLEMQGGEFANEEAQESISHILRSGYHLLELVDAVLDLSRIEAGHLDIQSEPIALEMTVNDCITQIDSGLANKRNITLINQINNSDLFILADPLRFRQVIINLLSNAVKYNYEGGSVTIKAEQAGTERICIMVTDTGKGIAASDIDKLFDPFERLSFKNGNIEGTGIGLTVTQQLVEAMHGIVGVESELGTGSTFWVELPLADIECLVTDMEKETIPLLHTPASNKHKVLYIEDNPVNARLISDALKRKGCFDLFISPTAEEGLTLAEEEIPDIILMDINLPGIDGIAALKILRKIEATSNIPVIAVTAKAMSTDIRAGQDAGFNDYLTKPIDIQQLYAVIEKHLTGQMTPVPSTTALNAP